MNKVFFYILILIILPKNFVVANDYEFVGKHLVVSYCNCDKSALFDEEQLKEVMKEAAMASGVTILNSSYHHFDPQGFTQLLLLSESHASIHTYPEKQACFVDLFTCGENFKMDEFDRVLTQYLRPKQISHKLLYRNEGCHELAFVPYSSADPKMP